MPVEVLFRALAQASAVSVQGEMLIDQASRFGLCSFYVLNWIEEWQSHKSVMSANHAGQSPPNGPGNAAIAMSGIA